MKYDKTFGDDRVCTCGHTYYRHFDWSDDYRPGCKYCGCYDFREDSNHSEFREACELPNGCMLYVREGIVGREYFSDEVGGGTLIWRTALADKNTLLAAILEEEKILFREQLLRDRLSRVSYNNHKWVYISETHVIPSAEDFFKMKCTSCGKIQEFKVCNSKDDDIYNYNEKCLQAKKND